MQHSSELAWCRSPSHFHYIYRYVGYLGLIYVVMFELTAIIASIDIDIAITFHAIRHYFALAIVLKASFDFLELSLTKYRIENSQLSIHTGVFNRSIETIELFRIKDITVNKPFLNRLFGLGNVDVVSSDETAPHTSIVAVNKSDYLADLINTATRLARRENGVKEID